MPLPRRLNRALLAVPGKLRASVRAAGAVLERTDAEIVVGFGGYVAMPAYLAARRRGIPFVIHEANARAGVANRFAARLTKYVYTASLVGASCRTRRRSASRCVRRSRRSTERRCAPRRAPGSASSRTDRSCWSPAARRVRRRSTPRSPARRAAFRAAGIQVLHIVGPKNTVDVAAGSPPYVVVPYVDGMQYAYAAADFVICRSGAMTCAELTAVGLPAAYVPLPLRGGEQRHNAEPIVAAGGGVHGRQREPDRRRGSSAR